MKKNHVEILELKTTLTEMNNSPEERKGRSELTTERRSKLEDGPTESLQPKDQRRKRKGKTKTLNRAQSNANTMMHFNHTCKRRTRRTREMEKDRNRKKQMIIVNISNSVENINLHT